MSRQGQEPKSQMVLKRPRQEDRLAQHSSSPSIPGSITPRFQGIDIVPAIRGVHEHMSTWMSSLIHAQGGCLQMVAQRASMGRAHQEHLAQQVAQRSMMPSMTDQVAYLRAQLAHRDAQLEQVRAERDNHFAQEEDVLAHMHLLSSEAKDWKSRVVTEAEEVLCREGAQIAQQATEAQEAMDQHCKAKWRQAEADLKALCQSNSAQVQSFASKLHETNEERSYILHKRDSYNSRRKPSEKHINMNNKQCSQSKSMRTRYRNFDVRLMSSQTSRTSMEEAALSAIYV